MPTKLCNSDDVVIERKNSYELSLHDFEVLDKLMANVLGHRPKQILTAIDIARIDQLKDRFAAAHAVWIETEE